MRWVLDTTAFSDLMKRDPALLASLKKHAPRNIVTVPLVIAEVQYGIARLDNSSKKYFLLNRERDRLLSVITILPWEEESSLFFGRIKTDLEQRGKIIDDFDIAIAGIALSHSCGIITANLGHFQRIKGLDCKDY